MTSYTSAPYMWSTALDRKQYKDSHPCQPIPSGSTHVQHARSDALLNAVQQGLVSMEDVLAFPVDWSSMAMHYNAQPSLRSQRSSSSLGLELFDGASTPFFSATASHIPYVSSHLHVSTASNTNIASTPSDINSMPPTPLFSVRELSSEPEWMPDTPVSAQAGKRPSEDKGAVSNGPLRKRRCFASTLSLSELRPELQLNTTVAAVAW